MKILRTILFSVLLAAAAVNTTVAQDKKPTKEERREERQRRIAERATAKTEIEVREGKHPRYSQLLKSTSYKLMYTEGLRYYRMKKKGKDYNSMLNYTKAQNLLSAAFQSQTLAGTPQEDSLEYYLGCSFFKSMDFATSEQIFDRFRRRFPSSIFLEDAEYMYAMGFYHASSDPEHDQTATLRAMAAIAEYEGRYPNTVKKKECDERTLELRRKLYVKSFENARLYYTIGQYKAAVRALNNAIDEFPESPYREELMYLATRSAYLFARNSVASQMTDRYMSMMDNYYNLISEFPETEHLDEVKKMSEEALEYITEQTKETTTTQTDGN
ncbi:MAG: outer membrane protein assembly factor BamD [Alistipes sp.]|jgi:outer membrane protein assembly factor BamD|nr:outer membrane protein assembly factor BamD [Alistipes sp.]